MSLVTTTTTQTAASEMSYQQKSKLPGKCALELSPALHMSNAAVRSTLLSFTHQFFRLNHALLAHIIFGGRVAALQTYLVAKDLAVRTASALCGIVWLAWNSKSARRLRRKLEFEFFVLILGCGNSLFLAVFWPGWIFVGLVYLVWMTLRFLAG